MLVLAPPRPQLIRSLRTVTTMALARPAVWHPRPGRGRGRGRHWGVHGGEGESGERVHEGRQG